MRSGHWGVKIYYLAGNRNPVVQPAAWSLHQLSYPEAVTNYCTIVTYNILFCQTDAKYDTTFWDTMWKEEILPGLRLKFFDSTKHASYNVT
jgi:hypothetical protein